MNDFTDDTTLHEKLADAATPGYQVELDPDEAERAGAFVEDALSESDATDSSLDLAALEEDGSVFSDKTWKK